MQSQARVVIIGGGVAGLSTLYHLTQEGWTDVVLLERNELTSGTTWHSAAQCPSIAFNQLLLLLRDYTIRLYKELADDPDYPINFHHATGGLRLLTEPDHVDQCHHILSVARGLGFDFDLISAEDAARHNPLLNTDGVLAALWDARDGDIDPAQLCQTLARRARNAGAAIHRYTPVTGLHQHVSGDWTVQTDKGKITAEHVVVAAGYRVNEVGEMLGITYPVMAMEHMYFITDDIPALMDRPDRVAMVRCPRDTFYMRQEKQGLLVGIYEHECKTFGMNGIDPDFVNALCPDDLDRLLPKMEAIFDRVPCLKEVGIKSVVNGPISYAADAGPLVGRQPGWRNLWSMNGIRVGIGEGGGYGKMLAQLMVHGETEWDCWQLDPRRIGPYATVELTALKAIEDYRHEFQWHMPHEHRPAGRPARTTSLYPVFAAKNAAFTVVNGWERVAFFKPDTEFSEERSYRFSNWYDLVGAEIDHMRAHVSLAELCGMTRFEITGNGARDWLDSQTCSRLSKISGRANLCYFLTERGNIKSEATIAQLPDGRIWYVAAAAAELHDMDWLRDHLPYDADIRNRDVTESYTALILAGPKTRDLLAAVSPRQSWAQDAFPWLAVRSCFIGYVEAVAMAISYSGEQAIELHVPSQQLQAVYEVLTRAGAEFNLGHFGMYAIEAMRLEKGYGHWKADFITEFNPIEAAQGHFVDLSKSFPGKKGLQTQIAKGLRRERVMLEVNSTSAPTQPGEGVFADGKPIGTITSASWGYRTNKNLAMAYLDPGFAITGTETELMLLGETAPATVVPLCTYDPENLIPRGLK